MVNSKNNDPDAFEDIKTYGFSIVPAKISDDKSEQMYVHGKFAQVKLKSTESLCVHNDNFPAFEEQRNYIGNHFFDPDVAQSKDARLKYVPIKDFDTLKKYLDASHQIHMAKLRKQVNAYIKEENFKQSSATQVEYFLDDKPDMLFIYRVFSYGMREGYPYEIRCDKKTGCLMQAEDLKAGKPRRRLLGTRIKKFDGRWFPNVLEVETLGSGHRTKIIVEKLKVGD